MHALLLVYVSMHDFYFWFLSCARAQTFLLSFLMSQDSFHIHSMCVCVWMRKKVQKVATQNGKRKMYFFCECLNLTRSKRKLKHIENERWTVIVVCSHMVAIKSKSFCTRIFQSMVNFLFFSLLSFRLQYLQLILCWNASYLISVQAAHVLPMYVLDINWMKIHTW